MNLVDERAVAVGEIIGVQDRERAVDLRQRLCGRRRRSLERARRFDVKRVAGATSTHFDRRVARQRLRRIPLQRDERAVGELELDVALRRSARRVVDDQLVHGAGQCLDLRGGRLGGILRALQAGTVRDGHRRAQRERKCGERRDRSGEMHAVTHLQLARKRTRKHLAVVFVLDLAGDLLSSRSVHAAAAAATEVSFVLARSHLGMPLAQRRDLRSKLDRRLRYLPAAVRYAHVLRSRRHDHRLRRRLRGDRRGRQRRSGRR